MKEAETISPNALGRSARVLCESLERFRAGMRDLGTDRLHLGSIPY
jgi:hypothetical protein